MNLARTPAADPSQPGPGGRRHTFGDLYHEHTNYQFIDRSWRWAVLSGTAVVVSVLFLVFGGLNLGIDFEGGTQWTFTRDGESASAGEVRDVLAGVGQDSAKVLILGSSGVRVQTEELDGQGPHARSPTALAEYAGVDVDEVSVTNVGPTWGDRVSQQGRCRRWSSSSSLIALYLSFRFEWRMALRRDRRGGPRHHHHRRRVRDHRVRGHARDGGGVPHHPRLLAVRHRRGVRQGQGERGHARRGQGRHLLDDGEPVAQPGADAVVEHLVRRGAPRGVAAGRRSVRARCGRPPGLRPRPARRPDQRRVLVDLRGDARSWPRSRSASRSSGRSASGRSRNGRGTRFPARLRRPHPPRPRASQPARATAGSAVATLEPSADDVAATDPLEPPDENGAAPEPPAEDGTADERAETSAQPAAPTPAPAPKPVTGGVVPRPRQQRRKRK